MWTIIVISLIPLFVIYRYWMIRKRKYILKRLPIGKRLCWSILCIIPPLITFIAEPRLSLDRIDRPATAQSALQFPSGHGPYPALYLQRFLSQNPLPPKYCRNTPTNMLDELPINVRTDIMVLDAGKLLHVCFNAIFSVLPLACGFTAKHRTGRVLRLLNE